MIAAVTAVALMVIPEALAKPPTLLSVGHINGHPTATWSLPAGVEAQVAEVATSPLTASDGSFFFENVVAYDTLEDAQTSWTYGFQKSPGTYYVHVSGLDRPCYFANQCPVREYSQIMTLVIGAPPPPGVSLTVFKGGSGSGTVTSDPPGIDCGVDCSETYTHGIHVMLTATPAAGSVFGGWNNVCGASPRCEAILTGPLAPTARFDLAPAPPSPPPPSPPPPGPVAVTPAGIDTTAPKAKALPSAGRAASRVRLRFVVSDNRGRTRQQIVVYRGSKVLARLNRSLRRSRPNEIAYVMYRIPRTITGPLRFCVVAWDAVGNASSRSCARLGVL